MRIAVFGTGAVGSYFGGRLAKAGEDVVLIARGENLKALQKDGLRVDSAKGDFVVKPVQATDDPVQVGVADVVLVGVKAWQVPEAAEAVRPLVGPKTFVVPLQNGLEAPEQLAAVLGKEHVLGGLCGLFTSIVRPGHIRHTDHGGEPWVRFGEMDNRRSERVERLEKAFMQAGVKAEIPPDIQVALWMKFLFVTPLSGVGAVTRAPVGVWRSLQETRETAQQAVQEIVSVGRARNIDLPGDAMHRIMAMFDGLRPGVTSSMQRDVMEGRPSELDALIGVVVRFGQEADVATPLHAFIYSILLPMELRARGQVQFPA
ncbi:MAG: 2-dehydropantoate 2-reductase [Promethearchaeota archaeon]